MYYPIYEPYLQEHPDSEWLAQVWHLNILLGH